MKPLYVVERTISYRAYIAADLHDVHDIAASIDLSEQVTEDTGWTAYEARGVDHNWWGALPYGENDGRTCGAILAYWRTYDEAWAEHRAADPNQLAMFE